MSARRDYEPELAEQFEDLEKQGHAARLGMWLFLGSEVLLFGGLFALYASYRVMYRGDFLAANAINDLRLGTANTFVLITSSFTVAMAVWGAQAGRPRIVVPLLLITLALGGVFLVIKGLEYADHFHHGIYPGIYYRYAEMPTHGARTFFTLYYFMSGLHAIHVVLGLAVLAWLAWRHWRRPYGPTHHVPLELGGLYWHLVDVIWIFLWPLLYLTR
jgi:cytochrome c oxidase subunit III